MPKKAKTSNHFTAIATRVPWWVSVLLSVISYAALYAVATTYRPAPTAQTVSATPKNASSLVFTLATIGQYILPLSFLGAAVASALHSQNKKQQQEFKGKLVQYYQAVGYKVIPQAGNRHNNMDLTLEKDGKICIVRCNHRGSHDTDMQQLRTFNAAIKALNAEGGVFVTPGEYTEEAWEYVEGRNIHLINGHRLQLMIPITSTGSKNPTGPPETATELTDYPDAWYNTNPPETKITATQAKKRIAAHKHGTQSPRLKKPFITAIVLFVSAAIGMTYYVTRDKPQDTLQPPKQIKSNEAQTPLAQQKSSPKNTPTKKSPADTFQKNTGYQKTIQWWQQTNKSINKFNSWIKASYAQAEKQTRQQKPNNNRSKSSQATEDAFGTFLESYYPGSTYDKNCSCGSIKVSSTSDLAFNAKSGTQSFRWTDQKTTRKTTFRNHEGTRYTTYEVSSGTNSIILLIDTDNPGKSHYIKAIMPDIAANAKKIGKKRRLSPPASVQNPIATILNDVYLAYVAKDNTGMNEYADQLVTDLKARQTLLRHATKLYDGP